MINKNLLQCFSLLFFSISSTAISQSFTDGPRNPTVSSNDASIGTVAWNTPGNVLSSDNNRATAGTLVGVLSSASTNYLVETGFGFAIPASAIITGIKVDVERRQQGVLVGSSVKDNSIKIVKGGVIVAGSEHASAGGWPSADALVSYGGAGDLWGTTWTPADINAANFGTAYASASLNAGLAALFLSAEIDHMRITVYYDVLLPIELLDFSAICDANKVKLKWATASQMNNDYFAIERSSDGIHFKEIGVIDGAGNSNQVMDYTFNDLSVSPVETNYYRLKQTDFDKSFNYSQIISVGCKGEVRELVYPNPSTGKFTVKAKGNISVFNALGDQIYTAQSLSDNHAIDLSDQSKGIYFVQQTSAHGEVIFNKILLE